MTAEVNAEMREFLARLHALYAEFPQEARAYESEFKELLDQVAALAARLAEAEAQLERESALLTEAKRQNADLMAIIDKPDLLEKYGQRLDHLGDWAVLCTDCAKTHKVVIVPTTTDKSGASDEVG